MYNKHIHKTGKCMALGVIAVIISKVDFIIVLLKHGHLKIKGTLCVSGSKFEVY